MPDPSASYTPLEPFRFWCQTVLPTVYDDSLSYYELLNKLVAYVNTCNTNIGVLHDENEQTSEIVEQLREYVDNYFDSLDIQNEINAKLDELAENGDLTNLLQPVVTPMVESLVEDWLDENIETPGESFVLDSSFTQNEAAANALAVGRYTLNEWRDAPNSFNAVDMPTNKFIYCPMDHLLNPPTGSVAVVRIEKRSFTANRFIIVVEDGQTSSNVYYTRYGYHTGGAWILDKWVRHDPMTKTETALTHYYAPSDINADNKLNISDIPVNSYLLIQGDYIEPYPNNVPTTNVAIRVEVVALNNTTDKRLCRILTQDGRCVVCNLTNTNNTWSFSNWSVENKQYFSLNRWAYPSNTSQDNKIDLTTVPSESFFMIAPHNVEGVPADIDQDEQARFEIIAMNNTASVRMCRIVTRRDEVYTKIITSSESDWRSNEYNYMTGITITASNKINYFTDFNDAPLNETYRIALNAELDNSPYGSGVVSGTASVAINYRNMRDIKKYAEGTLTTYGNNLYKHQVFITGVAGGPSAGYPKPYNVLIYYRTWYYATGWSIWRTASDLNSLTASNMAVQNYLIAPYLTAEFGTEGSIPTMEVTDYLNPRHIEFEERYIDSNPSSSTYGHQTSSASWSDGGTTHYNPLNPDYGLLFNDFDKAPMNTICQVDLNCTADVMAHHPFPEKSCVLITACYSYTNRHGCVQICEGISGNAGYLAFRYGYQQSTNDFRYTPWKYCMTSESYQASSALGQGGTLPTNTDFNELDAVSGCWTLSSANTYFHCPTDYGTTTTNGQGNLVLEDRVAFAGLIEQYMYPAAPTRSIVQKLTTRTSTGTKTYARMRVGNTNWDAWTQQ